MEKYRVCYCMEENIEIGTYEIMDDGMYRYTVLADGVEKVSELTVMPVELKQDYYGDKPVRFLQRRIDGNKRIGRFKVIGSHTDFYRLLLLDDEGV